VKIADATTLTPRLLRQLVAAEAGMPIDYFWGMALRQLGQGLQLLPDSPLQTKGGDRFVFCGLLAPCARYDLRVEIRLPTRKTLAMDVRSQDSLARLCQEIQGREGLLAARLRLFPEEHSQAAPALSPALRLCELSPLGCAGEGMPQTTKLSSELCEGSPPFVELDFFGRHSRRLPAVNPNMSVEEAWPSVRVKQGDVVFVSVRSAFGPSDEPEAGSGPDVGAVADLGVQQLFTMSEAWLPWRHTQTEEGVRRLLAVLHVVSAHCSGDDALKLTAAFRALLPNFSPAADSFRLVLGRRTRQVSKAERAAVASGMLAAIEKLIGGAMPAKEELLLEVGTRVLFYWLLRESFKDGAVCDAGWALAALEDVSEVEEAASAYCLPKTFQVLIRRLVQDSCAPEVTDEKVPAVAPWHMLVRQLQKGEGFEGPCKRWSGLLRVLSPLALAHAPKPSITRDEEGRTCVFTGTGKDVSRSTQLFLSTSGEEITVDVHHLAQKLKRLGDLGDSAVAEDTRPTREAIMVLLDTSNSMLGTSGFHRGTIDREFEKLDKARKEGWDDSPPDNSSPSKLQEVLEQFRAHPGLPDLKAACLRSAESCRSANTFARTAAKEMKALEILQELCRLERLKDTDPDICRFYTRHKDDFVAILCDDNDKISLSGAWCVEITSSKHRSSKSKWGKGKRSAADSATVTFALPAGTYKLCIQQKGKRLTGEGGGWGVKGTVDGNKASFNLVKNGMSIALCEALIADDGTKLCDGTWEGETVGTGSFTAQRTESGSDAGEETTDAKPPAELVCPITQQLMDDPVTCADGHSYECEALEHWVCTLGHRTSPLTGAQFPRMRESITKNHALRKQIEAWRLAHSGQEVPLSAAMTAAPGTFQIFCSTLTGKTITLDVDHLMTIGKIKERVEQKTGIPKFAQRLVYAGKDLGDSCSCADANLQRHSTLHLVQRHMNNAFSLLGLGGLDGDSKSSILVSVKFSMGDAKPKVALLMKPHETVEVLMLRIWCAAPDALSEQLRPSSTTYWSGTKSCGDGYFSGQPLQHSELSQRISNQKLERTQNPSGAQYYTAELNLLWAQRQVPQHERRELCRIECVKQLFHAFVNRSQAYDYCNEIGLALFGDEVQVVCPISPVFEDFRERVDAAITSGDTRLYDAVDKAADELEAWHTRKQQSLPADVALRVLVLSDGMDTKSGCRAWEVARRLQKASITVDAITIGSERDKNLHAIAKATGGYVFQPTSLANALRLNELEVLLSSTERPSKPNIEQIKSRYSLQQFEHMPVDLCDEDNVPAGRAMPLLSLKARELTDIFQEEVLVPPTSEAAAPTPAQQRRVMAELRQFFTTPHPSIEVLPSDDIFFWKMVLEGPEGTPYQGGLWVLYCHLSAEYPECPPNIRFVTPIRHCNVNAYGRVCHSILDRNYTADTTVQSIMHCIYGLLLNPDYEDPLDSTLALEFYEASGVYEDSIRRHVDRHAANRSREALRDCLMTGEALCSARTGFEVGQRVSVRDNGETEWRFGEVTNVRPPRAWAFEWGLYSKGHEWDEMRPLAADEEDRWEAHRQLAEAAWRREEDEDEDDEEEDQEDEDDRTPSEGPGPHARTRSPRGVRRDRTR
jgi:ubiquitin-protein ligase